MNYPNNIKKTKSKIITYDNRGMDLEILINKTNQYYLDNNIALVYKKPTPIQIVKTDNNLITKAFFSAPSTLDYNGLYNGNYLEFEAKETSCKTSFPLRNIHNHQIEHIRKVIKHQGICFLIIRINNLIYLLKGEDFIHYIDTFEKKSIPYNYLEKNAYLLKENYLKGLNYLEIVDKIYKGELDDEKNH